MATTIQILADGGTLRLTTTAGAGWGTLAFDATKVLRVLVAAGSSAERTMDAIIERPGTGAANQGVELLSDPAITTTSVPSDTLAVDFVFTGDAHGHPDHNRIYSGEAVEIVVCDSAIVTSGSNSTEAIMATTAVTNNSTATKPIPKGWVVSETHLTKQTGSFDVWVDVLSKYGVASVAVTCTDGTTSVTETTSLRITVETRATQAINGTYTPVGRKLDVYKVTFDAADFASQSVGTINVKVTDNIGTEWDSAVTVDSRISNRKVYLDKNSVNPTYTCYVNCHATVSITGESGGAIAAGDRIKGATSGAIGLVTSRIGDTLTYVWHSTLLFSSGETINVIDRAQANQGISATTTSVGARVTGTGGTIDDPNSPFDSVIRALNAVRTANNAAGRTANFDGAVIILQTHCPDGHHGSIFGFSTGAGNKYFAQVAPDQTEPFGYTPKMLGTPGCRTENIALHIDGFEIDTMTTSVAFINVGSSDVFNVKVTNSTLTNSASTRFNNAKYVEVRKCDTELGTICGQRGTESGGLRSGQLCVDVVAVLRGGAEGDYFLPTAGQGFAFHANVYVDEYQGSAAGNHSDIIQTVDATEPFMFHNLIASNLRYQFLFVGGATSNRCKGLGIINGIIEMADDGDMGSSQLAIDQACAGPFVFTNLVIVDSRDSGATYKGAILSGDSTELSELRLSNCMMGAVTYGTPQSPNVRVAFHNTHIFGTSNTGVRPSKSTSIGSLLTDVTTNDFEYPSNSNWASGQPYKRSWRSMLTKDNVDSLLTDVYGNTLMVVESINGKLIANLARPVCRAIARPVV